jgi:hypothetical protein
MGFLEELSFKRSMASTMRVDIVGSWRQSARPRLQSEQSRKYAWNACSRKLLAYYLFSQSPNIFSSGSLSHERR